MRKLILINAVLAALVGWGGLKVKRDWQQFRIDHNIQNLQAVSEVKLQPVIRKTIGPRPDDARQVAENNVFSFDRNDVAIKQAPATAATARPAGPKPVLFGTMLIGSPRMAMLGPGVSGNRSYRPMIVGEVIDGWTLVEVKDKSVVLESGAARETVFMNDPTAMIPRDYSRTVGAPQSQTATVRPTASQQQAAPPPSPAATGNNPQGGPAPGPGPKTRIIDTPFGKAKVIVDPQ